MNSILGPECVIPFSYVSGRQLYLRGFGSRGIIYNSRDIIYNSVPIQAISLLGQIHPAHYRVSDKHNS